MCCEKLGEMIRVVLGGLSLGFELILEFFTVVVFGCFFLLVLGRGFSFEVVGVGCSFRTFLLLIRCVVVVFFFENEI